MTRFFIDPDGVEVLAGRLGTGSGQAEDLAAGLQELVSALAELQPGEAPVVQARLDVIADRWRLGSSSLRERLRQLEAGEITEVELASVDVVAEVEAARIAAAEAEAVAIAEDLLNDEIRNLVATTDPVIIEGAALREGTRWVRDGRDSERKETFFYYIDENGDVVEVTVQNNQVVSDEGRYPVVLNGNGDPVVLLEGQTASQRVLDNLNGVGDGTTPTFGELALASSLAGASQVFDLGTDAAVGADNGDGQTGDRETDDLGEPIQQDDPRPRGGAGIIGNILEGLLGDSATVEVIDDPEKPETGGEQEPTDAFVISLPVQLIDEILGTDIAGVTGINVPDIDLVEIAETIEDIPVVGPVLDTLGLTEFVEFATKGEDGRALPENLGRAIGGLVSRGFEAIGDFFDGLFGGDDVQQDDREGSGGITDAERTEFGGPAEDFADSNGLL